MNSRERVMAAVNHKETDRVPVQLYTTPEIWDSLAAHFGADLVFERLGIDFRHVAPRWCGAPLTPPAGCDHADEWGVGYRYVSFRGGAYAEASYLPFKDMKSLDEVEAYPWPSADDFDYSDIEAQCDSFSRYAVCCEGAGTPDILNGVSRGRGMERVMMDIMMEDPAGIAIIDKRCDILYERSRRTLEAANGKIDILCLGEDCGNQGGPMFPLPVFEAFFRPRLERFYDLAHQFGAKAMMHSCGSTRKLMPVFVEMGLDILDAMQPEPAEMVPEEIKAEVGDKLAFCGLISTQQTLPFGAEEDCRKEARHRLRVMTSNGGYIFAPAHCIQPDTPLANVLAIYEEALQLEPGSLA